MKAIRLLTVILAAAFTTFAQNSASIPEIAKQVSKSVVFIVLRDVSGHEFAMGSGFIVRQDGIIATNHHVIDGASAASVQIANGDMYDAVWVGDADKRKDLALIRIKAINLPAVRLGDSDKLAVGQHVVAVGNPKGFVGSVSDGIVSALRQSEGYRVIQITAPISGGSSGGPLLNDSGEVVGITAGQFEGQNLNIAIPVNYIKPLLQFLDLSTSKSLAQFNAGALKTAPSAEAQRSVHDSGTKIDLLDGVWSATFADTKGSGHVDFNLIQNSEGEVVGTYTSSLGGGGKIKGLLMNADFVFELTQSLQDCPGVFKGKGLHSENRITGAYAGSDCWGDHGSGTFTMTKSGASSTSKEVSSTHVPDEMKTDSGAYLEKQLRVWTPENARLVLGEPVRHRYSYDDFKNINGDINAYSDPTRMYREFELVFDKQTNSLASIFIYPWNLTWHQCKQVWGDNVKTTKSANGSRFYSYRNKRLNILATNDGKVVSLGVY